jgi:ABC-2 type transport system permease protein
VNAKHREAASVAFVGVLVLYGQLFAYGYWVASGVVEEKSSRVVEVLLATVRPSHLLRGKIFGIGLLGLAQLLLIGVVGFVTAKAVGTLDFPSEAIATLGSCSRGSSSASSSTRACSRSPGRSSRARRTCRPR